MAENETPPVETPAAPDLSFIPDTFKDEDGGYKVDDYKAHVDGLAAFKAQADEAAAARPKEPGEYAWGLPDDYAFVEGFDPSAHQVPVLDDKGEPVIENGQPKMRDFTGADLLDADDPDIPLLQAALHEAGAPSELTGKLASIMVNRELRGMMKAGETAAAEKKALGPEGQSRMDTVERSLKARLPADQANAIFEDITSADALRGIEAILKASTSPPPPAPSGKDLDGMSNAELIALGMKQNLKTGT